MSHNDPAAAAPTQAQAFLREAAIAALAAPEMSARVAVASLDPTERDGLAASAASEALSGSGKALMESDATIAFEALCVSSREALADSVEAAFGHAAAAALRADKNAFDSLPERSACLLNAWRFPDGSFALRSRAADDSLEHFAASLLSCPALLLALGPERGDSIRRARSLAKASSGALALERDGLVKLVMSMVENNSWRAGTRVLTPDGSRELSPSDLLPA